MPENNLFGDPATLKELYAEFHEWYRQYVEGLGRVADKSIELNKQISAFHERLLLVALGTIGISLSALVSLGSRISASLAGRQTFLHYVAPAWILLLLSALASRNVMAFTQRVNRAILQDWAKRVDTYNVQQVVRSLGKLSKAISGTITIESKVQDISAVFAELGKSAQETIDQQKNLSLATETASDARQFKWQSRVAMWSMQVALVLLCVAAIRLFLLVQSNASE
jgi:hypothetical protein